MEHLDDSVISTSQVGATREELEQDLRMRAWKDRIFRQELLADPKAVLERDYAAWFPERKIPLDLSIQVIEETEQSISFVLPFMGPDDIHEIEDISVEEALEGVVGAETGFRCHTGFTLCCLTLATCGQVKKL